MTDLADTEIVIVGGGAVGCGVAYSLAQAGKTDVLLLEKEPALASVTSAQAAGLVGQVRSTVERTQLAMWSVRTFSALQDEPECNPSWRQVGSLRVAQSGERVAEFRQLLAVAAKAGLDAELVDIARARRLWPAMRFDEVKAILWCPSDGYLQPYDLAMAYRHHARRMGVRFATHTAVLGITCRSGHVESVQTSRGSIQCKTVINAAGAHAYAIARLVGLELPIVPVRHEYFVTVATGDLEPSLPVVRAPDATLYSRADVNSLLVGGWEPKAMSIDPRDFGLEDDAPRIDEDWSVLHAFAEQFEPLYPAVLDLGIRSVFKGWPTFVPDGRFVIGESCRVKGFVMAGGCNAHGVSGSAGIGRHVVEALLEEKPSAYVESLSPDRFTERSWDWATARRDAQRIYETYYAVSPAVGRA